MVAKCDEEVKEQLTPPLSHLHLHGATSLECVSAPDDQGKVVCSQLAVSVWCVGVGVSRRGDDG